MKTRVGFVVEQALGHVAYGLGLRDVLSKRDDIECVFLEIPFDLGDFRRVPLLGKNWTLRGSARAARAIAAEHKRRPLDALFIHTQTIGLFSAAHMARIPTMLSLDATPINYDEIAEHYRDKVHAEPVELAKKWIHRMAMSQARSFTTWSEWAKRSLVNDYGARASDVTVIHPGSIMRDFPERTVNGDANRKLRILFVGGDFERKGGPLLLDVYRSRLKDRWELDLVTGADLPPEPGVHVYRGLKPHSPELLARYAQADAFVLPTQADCLAVVLGEAMAARLPIVTTRVGAHAEAVEDGQSGFLLEPRDGKTLGDRLERLAADAELRVNMGRRARAIGEERFDMSKNANRIADLLLKLAGVA